MNVWMPLLKLGNSWVSSEIKLSLRMAWCWDILGGPSIKLDMKLYHSLMVSCKNAMIHRQV